MYINCTRCKILFVEEKEGEEELNNRKEEEEELGDKKNKHLNKGKLPDATVIGTISQSAFNLMKYEKPSRCDNMFREKRNFILKGSVEG